MTNERLPTMAELWATASDRSVSEETYWDRWEIVRQLVETTEHREATREEVASWRPRPDHKLTLIDLIEAANAIDPIAPMRR